MTTTLTPRTAHPGTRSARTRLATTAHRTAWGIVAAAALAATIFEVAKHGGATIPLAVLGGIGPDLSFLAGAGQPHAPGQLPARAVRAYNLAHRPWPPLVVMTASAFTGQPAAAALFTLGCAWLTHVALDRACGYGLRSAEGHRR